MNKIDGLHHLAITTADIKAQIEFFTDKLGMELVALYWMHGVENTFHGFLRLNDESSIALVHNPQIGEISSELGRTHAGNPAQNCAPGTMQHVALRVAGETELMALKDRLRSKGVPVVGPKDHGFCKSIYFAGPESLALELSYSETPIDARAWIDPEVMALAGISADELAAYKQPADYADEGGAVPQPNLTAPGPHMSNYPVGVYEKILGVSDEQMLAASENQPPVSVE
jgi:catechol 2,3-dioxygenase-like lactoylglutathione lyase family enzyme